MPDPQEKRLRNIWVVAVVWWVVVALSTFPSKGDEIADIVGTITVYFASNASCNSTGCGTPGPDLTPTDKVCAVNGSLTPVDCECFDFGRNFTPPVLPEIPYQPCQSCQTTSNVQRTYYNSIQEALDQCPYDPLVIEVSGTHHTGSLRFPNRTMIVIRGFLSEIVLQKCEPVDAATALDEDFATENGFIDQNYQYIINATYVRDIVRGSAPAVVVGGNHTVANPNTTVAFVNVTLDGCQSSAPLFAQCSWLNASQSALCSGGEPSGGGDIFGDASICELHKGKATGCPAETGFLVDCELIKYPSGPCYINGVRRRNCKGLVSEYWNCTLSAEDPTYSDVHEALEAMPPDLDYFECKIEVDVPPWGYPPFSMEPDPEYVNHYTTFVDCRLVLIIPEIPPCEGCTVPVSPQREEIYDICPEPVRIRRPPHPCAECLTDNDFYLVNSAVRNFAGDYGVVIYATELDTSLYVENSTFVDIPGYAIHAQGLENSYVINSLFERVGGFRSAAVYLKLSFASRGDFVYVNNIMYFENSTLDFPCDYYLNGEVKCVDGYLQCINFLNTTLNDCDIYNSTISGAGVALFDETCAVFEPCPCSQEPVSVLFNGTEISSNATNINVTADGMLVSVKFDVSYLGIDMQVGKIYFFPCSASNSTPGANQTVNPGSTDNVIVGSSRCPLSNGFLDPLLSTTCYESQTCPCPQSRQKRNSNCNGKNKLTKTLCQGGTAFCKIGRTFGGVAVSPTGGIQFEAPAADTSGSVSGSTAVDPSSSSSSSVSATCNPGEKYSTCECPVLFVNITDTGTVGGVREAFPTEAEFAGSCSNYTCLGCPAAYCILSVYDFTTPEGAAFSCSKAGFVECDCGQVESDTRDENGAPCFEMDPCATSLHIANVPQSVSKLRIVNNVAEGLYVGLRIERVSAKVVRDHTYLVPNWIHDKSALYELARINNFTGTINDTVEGSCEWYWSNQVCNGGCPMYIPRDWVDACSVDSRYSVDTPGYGQRRFRYPQEAINLCDLNAVLIHNSGGDAFSDQLVINRTDFFLGSLNGAVINSQNHTISAHNVTIRGLVLLHPGTTRKPLFWTNSADERLFSYLSEEISRDLLTEAPANLTIMNCAMLGGNVKDAGAIVGNVGVNFTFRYNSVVNFQLRAVDVVGPGTVNDISFNQFYGMRGRSLRLRGAYDYYIVSNHFIDCRGIARAKDIFVVTLETADVSFAPTLIDFDDEDIGTGDTVEKYGESQGRDEGGAGETIDDKFVRDYELSEDLGCFYPFNATQKPCMFAGNIQSTNPLLEDIDDGVFMLRGGLIPIENVRDNVATKGRYGLYAMWVVSISKFHHPILHKLNPLIRVSDVQTDEKLLGYDIMTQDVKSGIRLGCAFPECRDYENDPPDFEVNPNYDWLITPEYGFNKVHNISHADRYLSQALIGANDVRGIDDEYELDSSGSGSDSSSSSSGSDSSGSGSGSGSNTTSFEKLSGIPWEDITRFPIRITQTGGARIWRENITLTSSASYYSTYFCNKPSMIIGVHNISAFTANFSDVMFLYDGFSPELGQPMWVNNVPSFLLAFLRVTFHGGNRSDAGIVKVMDVVMDKDYGIFHMNRCAVHDWYHIPIETEKPNTTIHREGRPVPRLRTPDGKEYRQDMVPGADGVYVRYGSKPLKKERTREIDAKRSIKYKAGTSERYRKKKKKGEPPPPYSYAYLDGNYFSDLDGRVISIEGPWNLRMINTTIINCGTRKAGEPGIVFVRGLIDSTGSYVLEGTYYDQERPTLFPQVGTIKDAAAHKGAGVFTSGISIEGLCNVTNLSVKYNKLRVRAIHVPTAPVSRTSKGIVDGRVVAGASVALRFSGVCKSTLYKNMAEGNIIYFTDWREREVPLREPIAYLNPEAHGIICDVLLCPPMTDIFFSTKSFASDCVCCNGGCIVPPPDDCVVDRDNSTFREGNPYFGTYLFRSLNDAVTSCKATSKIIRLRAQKGRPYEEKLLLSGPGGFNIIGEPYKGLKVGDNSNYDKVGIFKKKGVNGGGGKLGVPVIRGSNILVATVSGLTFTNVIFEHEGGAPTIVMGLSQDEFPKFPTGGGDVPPKPTPYALLSNLTLVNCSFDGGGTKQAALSGYVRNLTITGSLFFDYEGLDCVRAFSNCGYSDIENNEFNGIPGYSLRLLGQGSYEIASNEFRDCGGRYEGAQAVVYLGVCKNNKDSTRSEANGPFDFRRNRSLQLKDLDSIQPRLPKLNGKNCRGYVATYYLDGLTGPNATGSYYIYQNKARGLPVGLRLGEYPTYNYSHTGWTNNRPRLKLQQIAYAWGNTEIQGTHYYILVGRPEDDCEVDKDPDTFRARFCNEACTYKGNNFLFGIPLFFIFALVFLCCACSAFRKKRRINMVQSNVYSNVNVPSDPDYWPVPLYNLHSGGGTVRATARSARDPTETIARKRMLATFDEKIATKHRQALNTRERIVEASEELENKKKKEIRVVGYL